MAANWPIRRSLLPETARTSSRYSPGSSVAGAMKTSSLLAILPCRLTRSSFRCCDHVAVGIDRRDIGETLGGAGTLLTGRANDEVGRFV